MKNQKRQNKKFALMDSPDAYVVSVHMRNMMATYGEARVKDIVKELFLQEARKTKRKSAVGE